MSKSDLESTFSMNDSEPVYVNVTNVVRWWIAENTPLGQKYDLELKFPGMLSPWNWAVYEFNIPVHNYVIESNRKMIKNDFLVHTSATVLCGKIDNGDLNDGYVMEVVEEFLGFSVLGESRSRIEESINTINRDGIECGYVEIIAIETRELPIGGVVLNILDVNGNARATHQVACREKQRGIWDLYEQLHVTLLPLWFVFSLLNCKNVKVVDRPVSRQMRRRAERTGMPVTVYKELVIEPFKQQVRNEAKGDGMNEIKRALHLCRGHFREYTNDKPLFGRVTGRFWIPQHLRGLKDIGEVHKTYRVDTDEK